MRRAVPRQAVPLCWPESHSSTSAFQAIVVTHFRSPCQPLLLLVLRLLYSSCSSNLLLSIRLVDIKVQDYVNPIYILRRKQVGLTGKLLATESVEWSSLERECFCQYKFSIHFKYIFETVTYLFTCGQGSPKLQFPYLLLSFWT